MGLAREFDLSSDQLVSGWSSKWRKGGDEALKPKPKGRPKGSTAPRLLSEEDKLRRQAQRLEAENAYLKIAGLEESGTRLKVQAIVILKSHHRLEYLLDAAGIPRSTFFYHQNDSASQISTLRLRTRSGKASSATSIATATSECC